MLDAKTKAILALYFRELQSKIEAGEIDGILAEGQLPSELFADIDTNRLANEAVTGAKIAGATITADKLGFTLLPIVSRQGARGVVVPTGDSTITITAVDLSKAVLIANLSWAGMTALLSNATTISVYNGGSPLNTIDWTVLEFA